MTRTAAARSALLAVMASTLTACGSSRDAASEEPVEVTPGYYSIELTGGYRGFSAPKQAGDEPDGQFCVMEGQQADFPRRVAMALALHPGCTQQPSERTGNLVTGGWRCPTDPQRAPGGSWNMTYTGTISREAVELTGQMEIDMGNMPNMTPAQRAEMEQATATMERMEIGVTATRTGDCG